MNPTINCGESVANRANRYNLDDLLKVLTEWNDPNEVRRYLLTIYFQAAQYIFNDQDVTPGKIGESFSVLQEIIESLENVNETNNKQLFIGVK